ncbi:TnsA-like heteromeric transposase endonuclease subunit [Streptomyces sp. NPDC088341]|uniref:TnsA-like heteromeric transposase endonuclease subunit n=1 Tax=Streptomyces sp. NPDC088341 TaxID=3154870 RepID=UPI0034255D3B
MRPARSWRSCAACRAAPPPRWPARCWSTSARAARWRRSSPGRTARWCSAAGLRPPSRCGSSGWRRWAAFPVVPGRRWGPGWWWSATTGRHVMHGSQAMCTQLMILDRDPQVVALSARPVRLIWHDPGSGRALTWVPQLFARYADRGALLADCPAATAPVGDRAERAVAVLEAACEAVGFTYRRLAPPEMVVAANVRWLAGYRHPRHRDAGGLEQAVLEAFAAERPLMAGAAAAGEVLTALPVLYHALWSGRPAADLTRPLGEHTLVSPGPAAGDGKRREQQES